MVAVLVLGHEAMHLIGAEFVLFQKPMASEHVCLAIYASACPLTGNSLVVLARRRADIRLVSVLDNRLGDGMLAALLDGCRQRQERFPRRGLDWNDFLNHRSPRQHQTQAGE